MCAGIGTPLSRTRRMILYVASAKAKPVLPRTASENLEELRYTMEGKNLDANVKEGGVRGHGVRTAGRPQLLEAAAFSLFSGAERVPGDHQGAEQAQRHIAPGAHEGRHRAGGVAAAGVQTTRRFQAEAQTRIQMATGPSRNRHLCSVRLCVKVGYIRAGRPLARRLARSVGRRRNATATFLSRPAVYCSCRMCLEGKASKRSLESDFAYLKARIV